MAALDPVKEDPQAYAKIKQAPFTHKSQAGISRAEIAYMFRLGRPANDLSKTGLTVHCFDGTEDWKQPWAPCLCTSHPESACLRQASQASRC